MPSPKLRAEQYLLVTVAACSAVNPVGAEELAAATGVYAKNCGLVPVFIMNTGLLTKGHRRATYLPSEKGRYIARAFARGEAEGLGALRTKWRGQWFARTVRDRCRHGPVSRDGLVAALMVAAKAGPERIKQAHVLLDLMVAVGLVTVEKSGELNYFEGASHTDAPPTGTQNTDTHHEAPQTANEDDEPSAAEEPLPQDECQSGSTRQPDSEGVQDGDEQPQTEVPRPRTEAPGGQLPGGTGPDQDLLSLLLPPVLLADLTHLTSAEVLELHSHLTAVTALTAKLRGHRVI
ncbi:hypothetical protein [Streptomyces sp. ADI95-17]|uniref:hypothetical protein n=1 Tax=unclassified Streptomyces TaxID=2593676 RepID=UPI000F5B9713|nr:hypothetical protein [Streptomyces sp. ADI95-17]RPK58559.1 hypothetical protein EES42_37675 [Streptomyces sp. ADI95-17]